MFGNQTFSIEGGNLYSFHNDLHRASLAKRILFFAPDMITLYLHRPSLLFIARKLAPVSQLA